MTHVTEKLAEFVFEELSEPEMAEAQTHLAGCSTCREQVHAFQRTHSLLKASPDVDLPRRILFEFEKPALASNWLWRWVAPMAASAAVALAVVTFVPRTEPQPQVIHDAQQVPPAPAAQPVDYQKMLDELRTADRAWMESELQKRAAVQAKEMDRVRGDMATLNYYQQKLEHLVGENSADVQLLAAKTDARE